MPPHGETDFYHAHYTGLQGRFGTMQLAMMRHLPRLSMRCNSLACKGLFAPFALTFRSQGTSAFPQPASTQRCWPPPHLSHEDGKRSILDAMSEPFYPHLADRPYLRQPIPLASPNDPANRIKYEVTLEIDEDIVEGYLAWIQEGHIQEVMALPGFVGWNISASEDSIAASRGIQGQRRVVFVEQYEVESREFLEKYFIKYAQGIRDDHSRMWEGKFAASRRILHTFGRQTDKEAELWKQRDAKNSFRLNNLLYQVDRVPRFTSEGLKVQALPSSLWETLEQFYRARRHESVEDRLDPSEISINTWVSPTLRLDLPPALASEVVGTLKPILESWCGVAELESTGISGIRTYLPGATIQEHVDMATTNVVSALINLDQDVKEPWPFEMRDHSGKLHALHMRPGEVVMYESAKCAHRRSRPLPPGGYYTNLFLRFKPKGWTFTY